MFGIGPMELVLILVVALLVLGPKRMPELARTLGRGLGEFRKASSELRQSLALDEIQNELRDGIASGDKAKTGRPAQAGDDLPPPTPPTPPETQDGDASGPVTAANPVDEAANPVDEAAEGTPHPGELPLGNDTEHHDDPDAPPEDSDGSEPPSETASTATHASTRPLAQAADSELGSVPVGEAASDTERDRG